MPSIRTAVAGTKVPVWQASAVNDFTEGIIETGPNCNANISWSPFMPTDLTYSNSGNISCLIPRNGMFIPTSANPFTVMKVRNTSTGCSKDYKSIRYILTNGQAELSVVPSNRVVCIGSAVCFEATFDAHVSNYQTSLLPSKITLQYQFQPPNGSGQLPSLPGTLELNLINSLGVYKGTICDTAYFKFPTVIQNENEIFHYRVLASIVPSDAVIFGYNPPFQYDCQCEATVLIDAKNTQSLPNLQSCFISTGPPPPYNYSVDIGSTSDVPIACDNNHRVINGDMKIIAGSYIEIHPGGEISLEYLSQLNKGPLLLINPCIQHHTQRDHHTHQ